MRRDLIPGRHWAVCACCLVVAALPVSARERLRGRLLDLVRLGSHVSPPDEAPAPAKVRELENRLARSEAERVELERALDEVRAISTLTAERADLGLVPAEAFPLAGPADLVKRLVLGRGERDGVARGAPVLSGDALVGLVARATRDRAEVRLATDPTFRVRAAAPRLGIEGIVSGTGESLLAFVPALSGDEDPGRDLRPGDALVVSRASTLCAVPAVIGYVRDVKRIPGDATTRATVAPAVPVAQLTHVVVVRPREEALARRPGGEAEGR